MGQMLFEEQSGFFLKNAAEVFLQICIGGAECLVIQMILLHCLPLCCHADVPECPVQMSLPLGSSLPA